MTKPPPDSAQEIGRSLSDVAACNLRVAMGLRRTARLLTEAGVRAFRPTLDEAAVQAEVRAQFRRAGGSAEDDRLYLALGADDLDQIVASPRRL